MHQLFRIIGRIFRRFILRRPRVVRILAAGATRDFCPPDLDAELWSMNRFWRTEWLPREPDRWFEIHQPGIHKIESGEVEAGTHEEWLRKGHDFPIYFLQEAHKYPSGVRYPIEEIGPEFDWYLTSSLAYMVALAIYKGFDRIELYGCEMPQGSDYFWQRPNIMYLMGRGEGEFVHFHTPPGSTLKREPMYAYEADEVAYDNWLRRELHTVKRHGFELGKYLQVHKGVVQGIQAVIENFKDIVPEIFEHKEVRNILVTLNTHHKAQARKYESAANVLLGERLRIIKELSYRDTPIGTSDIDVAEKGSDIEMAVEFARERQGGEDIADLRDQYDMERDE